MRARRWALLAWAVAGSAGCATAPSFLRTDELMPAVRSGSGGETEFFVRLEAFLDERGDRTSVGSVGGMPLVTDRDVVEVFEKVTARALERKGIRPGPSPLSVRGTVRVANVGSLSDVGGEGVRVARSNLGARVEMQLEVFNPASKAVLWRKEFQGRGAGGAVRATSRWSLGSRNTRTFRESPMPRGTRFPSRTTPATLSGSRRRTSSC